MTAKTVGRRIVNVGCVIAGLGVLAIVVLLASFAVPVAFGTATLYDPMSTEQVLTADRIVVSGFLAGLVGFVLVVVGAVIERLGRRL